MPEIKVKTPAKINLTLEILGKRPDGFHNIQSIMQAVNLYDYLTISTKKSNKNKISITGNSTQIPYNKSNLAHKAAELFCKEGNIENFEISINIEKNIPVAAGLAGGSSNAAGVLYGLNILFDNLFTDEQLHKMASMLGSDLNFCLSGGTKLATSRGEILQDLPTPQLNIILAKPKELGISAKEAYTKYAKLKNKPQSNKTQAMVDSIRNNQDISTILKNDLEYAIIDDYPQIKQLKQKLIEAGCKAAMMSGSGPTVFGITKEPIKNLVIENTEIFCVKSISQGVSI